MTVRAILDTKGHQILSVEPDAKLSAAVKILGERKIGAVLVMSQGRLEGILSERDIVRVLGERGAKVLDEAKHQAEAAGATVEVELVAKKASEALVDVAEKRDARMIVVGSFGDPPLKGMILGSTPNKLLHLSERPILVVPAQS